MLLEYHRRRRSPTPTILERLTDIYALVIGMRIPDTDGEPRRENIWHDRVEKFCDVRHRDLWIY